MNQITARFRWYIAAILFLCTGPTTLADVRSTPAPKSGSRYDWSSFSPNLEFVLSRRLKDAQNAIRLRADNAEQFKRWIEKLGYDLPDDPEALYDYAKDFVDRAKSGEGAKLPDKQRQDLQDALNKISKLPKPKGDPNDFDPVAGTTGQTTDSRKARKKQDVDRGLMQFTDEQLERMQQSRLGKVLTDSSAFQKAFSEWRRFMMEGGSEAGVDAFQLPDWPWTSQLEGLWSDLSDSELLSQIDLPQVSMPSLGRLNIPSPPPPAPPSLQTPSISDAGQALLALLLVVLCGVLAAQILRRRHAGRSRREFDHAELLGPWPVDPHRISNSDELIAAFEYLGLLYFGSKARTWNHRDIAYALQQELGVDSHAAQELASLYQHARYAPEKESLTPESFQLASRHLCQFARLPIA